MQVGERAQGRAQVVHVLHGHAHCLEHALSVGQQLSLVKAQAQVFEVDLGAGVDREEPEGVGG